MDFLTLSVFSISINLSVSNTECVQYVIPSQKKTCQSWSRNTILGHPTIFMQKKATGPNVRDLVPTLDLPFIGSYLEISRRCEKRAALRNHEYYKERHGNQTHRGCPRPQGGGLWGDPQKLLDIYIDWIILVCFSRIREAKPQKNFESFTFWCLKNVMGENLSCTFSFRMKTTQDFLAYVAKRTTFAHYFSTKFM